MNALTPWVLGLATAGGGPDKVRRVVNGRLVVVTGISRGIGREVARRLVSVGATVIGIARTPTSLDDLTAPQRGAFHMLAGDLRDTDWATSAGQCIVTDFGPPALVVSNAGHSIHRHLEEYTERFHDVARTTGVNYLGAVALALPLLAAMRDAGAGHLLSVTTTSVDVPTPGWSVYSASKAAYETWLRTVAPELRANGVATTSVHLPRVTTAMSAPTAGRYPMPELTVAQAADVICRAIVRRPHHVVPWWARVGAAVSGAWPDGVQRAWEIALRAGVQP